MARSPLFGPAFDRNRQRLMQDPRYQMALQAQQRGMSTAPVQSPLEGLARALQAPVGAMMAGSQERQMQERQRGQYEALADQLLGPRQMTEQAGGIEPLSAPEMQPDPRRDQLMQALTSGAIPPEALGETLMRQMGLGPAAEPIKVGDDLVMRQQDGTYAPVYQSPEEPIMLEREARAAGFSNPREYMQWKAAIGRGPDQRQQKINSLSQRLGGGEKGRQRAEDIVDGNVDIEIVPETGRARLINKINNTVEEIPIAGTEGQVEIGQPQLASESLYSTADEAAGIVPSLKDLWSRTAGQLSEDQVFQKTVQGRSRLNTAKGELLRALAQNPRFPVGEMKRIEQEVDIGTSVWDSPQALRDRMQEIDRSLRSRARQAQQDADDPSLPEEARSSQAQNARAIQNFLQRLGVPGGGEQQQQQPAPVGQPQATPQSLPPGTEVDGYRFRGGNPNDPNSWERVQ